jgi:hypothetical protein
MSVNSNHYDDFAESQLEALCPVRKLHVPNSSLFAMQISLLLEDQELGVTQAIAKAVEKARPVWKARQKERDEMAGLLRGGRCRMEPDGDE